MKSELLRWSITFSKNNEKARHEWVRFAVDEDAAFNSALDVLHREYGYTVIIWTCDLLADNN